MLKEWPLVAFTIVGQMAVGIFLIINLPLLLTRKILYAARTETWLVILALVGGLMALAALLSFFHLHHPFRARRVLTNFRTSWLSREIFFELGFMALVALGALLAWRRPAEVGLLKAVLIMAGFAGILFLVSMAKLYMLPTVPPWNQAYTPLSFFMTSLSLGALTTALVWRARVGQGPYSDALLGLTFSFVLLEIVLALLITPRYGAFGYRPGPSLRPPDKTPRLLHLGRLTLLAAGLFFIGLEGMAVEFGAASRRGASLSLVLAFVLVLASEVAGRFLFYGLLARPGR